jgi:prefoldin subunit 5
MPDPHTTIPPEIIAAIQQIAEHIAGMREDIHEMRTISREIVAALEAVPTVAVAGDPRNPYLNP